MLSSNQRMQFIIEYISAYESKIKLANQNGLFDNAKLFELFALNLCELWFEKKFSNLNTKKSNYPYVDLISSGSDIFVQVSTAQDTPSKIKKTLEKIRDSKKDEFKQIKHVYFFVLENESLEKVSDLTGENQIGNIQFKKEEHLISTDSIVQKAQFDLSFQEKLYNLLKSEFDNFSSLISIFNEQLNFSKNISLNEISYLINNEFEINRKELLEKIEHDAAKYIMIEGEPGAGKSGICKKFLSRKELVLFARAERFSEESDINNIWHLNIKHLLTYLDGKEIYFYIDALEFISDGKKTTIDLLEELFLVVKDFKNAKIITSCRTSEKQTFVRIESNYPIKSYIISQLTQTEQNQIIDKYPKLSSLRNSNSYSDLVKSPFYINLIIENNFDLDTITDENDFRKQIWEEVICLKKKSRSSYQIEYSDIQNTIDKIVFKRAKEFSLGVHQQDLDSAILLALKSEGIVAVQNNLVRLKSDIYEDICFENYLDREFYKCRGQFQKFFENISELGRCVHRRYQIWISNKLFLQQNQEKFLSKLIFSDYNGNEWKKQTQIGIVKSKYCQEFFKTNSEEVLNSDTLLKEFIKVINLFAFEFNYQSDDFKDFGLLLKPIGEGRSSIIELLFTREEVWKNPEIRTDIIKLCLDFSKQEIRNENTEIIVCQMMQYYVTVTLEQGIDYKNWITLEIIVYPSLEILYRLSKVSYRWLIQFFKNLKNCLVLEARDVVAEHIIEWTLDNCFPELIKQLSIELCDLIEIYWAYQTSYDKSEIGKFGYAEHELYFGLNQRVKEYSKPNRRFTQHSFIVSLLNNNFNYGFKWIIKFINNVVSQLKENAPQNITEIRIHFIDEKLDKKYWGNPELWLAGLISSNVPTVIGDMIFFLKQTILGFLNAFQEDEKILYKIANYFKEKIYKESNNIALLTIIDSIGKEHETNLPGYSLDLISSIDLLYYEQNMELTPFIGFGDRYGFQQKKRISLQQYATKIQLLAGQQSVKDYLYRIFDYLYELIPNDEENALDHLQVKKCDLRKVNVVYDNESKSYVVGAAIDRKAGEIVRNQEERNLNYNEVDKKIQKCFELLKSELTDFIEIENLLIEVNNVAFSDEFKLFLPRKVMTLLVELLKQKHLKKELREECCIVILEEAEKLLKLDSHSVFLYDEATILFEQLNENINNSIKNKIKKYMLDIITYDGTNGINLTIRKQIEQFLNENQMLSKKFFNTIVKIAEDEMKHQSYNIKYYQSTSDDRNFVFKLNDKKIIPFIDSIIQNNNDEWYRNNYRNIIEKYLYGNVELLVSNYDINNYSIKELRKIIYCGSTFKNEDFCKFLIEILNFMIQLEHRENTRFSDYRDLTFEADLKLILQQEIFYSYDISKSKTVVDLLFSKINIASIKTDIINFYLEIFGDAITIFFDGHTEIYKRNHAKQIVKYLEQIIISLPNSLFKNRMYRTLTLSLGDRYYGDWGKLDKAYTYKDIEFLNIQFKKYGSFHPDEVMKTIDQLGLEELLPSVLLSISYILESNGCFDLNKNSKRILREIILLAFTKFNDEIKQDDELSGSLITIFSKLIEENDEIAAVLLDEFLVH